jgi:hypothetical protein
VWKNIGLLIGVVFLALAIFLNVSAKSFITTQQMVEICQPVNACPQLSPQGSLPPNSGYFNINAPQTMSTAESSPISVSYRQDITDLSYFCPNDKPKNQNDVFSASVDLFATTFNISPKEQQPVEGILQKTISADWTWIISPQTLGTQDINVLILVKINDCVIHRENKQLAVTVVNTFGLTNKQAEFLKLFSAIFAPIPTIPWWITLIRKWWGKKRNRSESKRKGSTKK